MRRPINAACLAFALALAAAARPAAADPAATLADHLERILGAAAPDLTECGTSAGLTEAPPVEIRLRMAGGRIKVDLKGLELVAKAKRKAVDKCLRAAIAKQLPLAGEVAFRAVNLAVVQAPVKLPPWDPVAARACTTAADCTIMCEHESNCCSGQCGCSNAVNRNYVEVIRERSRVACSQPQRCPAVGCALQHFSAQCVKNKCVSRRGDF